MKIEIEGRVAFDTRYERWDELVDEYALSEAGEGRVVPPYALETLLIAVGIWLLEKAASRAIDWAIEYPRRRQDEEDKRQATRLSHEAIERIKRLELGVAELRSLRNQEADRQALLIQVLRDAQPRLVITPETGAERDVARQLQMALRSVSSAEVELS